MTAEWFIRRGQEQWGPYPTQRMKEMVASGNLHPDDLVWRDGLNAWQAAGSVTDFFPRRPPPLPAPQAEARIAYVRVADFRVPRYCVGCMLPDPSRRTCVSLEETVVGSGGPNVLMAIGTGYLAAGLVGATVVGIIAESMQRSAIEKRFDSFEFPICRACQQREEATFFSRADRLVQCILYGNDLVFVFANVEYAAAFRELNRLGPPPRGFVMAVESSPPEPAPTKPVSPPPEDSPFANLEGPTNEVIRKPRKDPRR